LKRSATGRLGSPHCSSKGFPGNFLIRALHMKGYLRAENMIAHVIDVGANYFSLWNFHQISAKNLMSYYQAYPVAFDQISRRIGYRVRPSFIWSYRDDGYQGLIVGFACEFLRRFCQHLLPRGFVRIRHFGYLASAHRTSLLALARQQLACQPLPSSHLTNSPLAIWRCPRCGANMLIGPNLNAQQLAFRCMLTDSS